MPKIIQPTKKAEVSTDPVEIIMQLGKTIQEKQFEPFSVQATMKVLVPPNEVSSEFRRCFEVLEGEVATALNNRLGVAIHGPSPKRKGRHLRY